MKLLRLVKCLPRNLLENLVTAWHSVSHEDLVKVTVKFDFAGKKRSDNQEIFPNYKK